MNPKIAETSKLVRWQLDHIEQAAASGDHRAVVRGYTTLCRRVRELGSAIVRPTQPTEEIVAAYGA